MYNYPTNTNNIEMEEHSFQNESENLIQNDDENEVFTAENRTNQATELHQRRQSNLELYISESDLYYLKLRKYLKFFQIFFFVVGVNLGIGILGLPISSAESGIFPLVTAIITVTLFQLISINSLLKVIFQIFENLGYPPLIPDLVRLLLPKYFIYIIPIVFNMYYATLLISYGIAGGQTLSEFLNIPRAAAVPLYTYILSSICMVFSDKISNIISSITFVKVLFLTVTVLLVTSIGNHRLLNFNQSKFNKMTEPMLLSTVAIGGIQMLLPTIWAHFYEPPVKCKIPVKLQKKIVKYGVFLGIIVSSVLCVIWSFAITTIVPQNSFEICDFEDNSLYSGVENYIIDVNDTSILPNFSDLLSSAVSSPSASSRSLLSKITNLNTQKHLLEAACKLNISIARSSELGEISTVPVMDMYKNLDQNLPPGQVNYYKLDMIVKLTSFFTATSTTVNYLAIGTGLLDTVYSSLKIGGFEFMGELGSPASSPAHGPAKSPKQTKNNAKSIELSMKKYLTGYIVFTIVFLLSVINAKEFERILEKYTSFLINFISGPVIYMLFTTTFGNGLIVSVSVRDWGYFWEEIFRIVALIYFSVCMVYSFSV